MRTLVALLELSFLIAFHEVGHALMARVFGIRTARITLGMGPALFRWRVWGTEWLVRLLPLGAGVQLEGENPHEGELTGISVLPPWRRLAVVAAGPLASYLVGLVVLFALFVMGTHVPVPLTVGTVEPGGQAARALIRPGDQVLAVDGAQVATWTDFAERVAQSPGVPLTLTVIREGEPVVARVVPDRSRDGLGHLGLTQQYVFRQHHVGEALVNAFVHTGRIVVEGAQLLVHQARGRPTPELGSPLNAVRTSAQSATGSRDGFWRVFAAISVALALFYLLPIPGLDGGRMVLLVIEAAAGRPLSARWVTTFHTIGFLALMGGLLALAGGELVMALRRSPVAAKVAQNAAAVIARPRPDAGTPEDAGTLADAWTLPDGGSLDDGLMPPQASAVTASTVSDGGTPALTGGATVAPAENHPGTPTDHGSTTSAEHHTVAPAEHDAAAATKHGGTPTDHRTVAPSAHTSAKSTAHAKGPATARSTRSASAHGPAASATHHSAAPNAHRSSTH